MAAHTASTQSTDHTVAAEPGSRRAGTRAKRSHRSGGWRSGWAHEGAHAEEA